MKHQSFNTLGLNIAAENMDSAVNTVSQWLSDKNTGHYICATTTHSVVESLRNQKVKESFLKADMCVPDGMPLVWLGKYHGHKNTDRVYGPDLMLKLLELSTEKGFTNYFYGGKEGVAEDLKNKMKERFPGLKVAGTYCPPFRELNDKEETEIIDEINSVHPEILWIGIGTPKQDLLMKRLQDKGIKAKIMIGVGAAFDFHTGRVKQAPKWMQRIGMEWLFRMCAEPKRLIPRYLKNNPVFIWNTFLQLTGLKEYPAIEKTSGKIPASRRMRPFLIAAIVALTIIAYHLLGNRTTPHLFGNSSLTWMVQRWGDYGGRFSHCWLIPFVSIGIIFWKRIELKKANKKTSYAGLFIIIASLLLQLISIRTRLPRLSIMSLIGLLWGIPFYLYGWQVARLLIFPCAYLLFCIPLTFLDSMTFPLRLFAAKASSLLLDGIGISTYQIGTAICSADPAGFKLDIADPCSGLRYFLVLLSLTAAYAYITQKTFIKKWILFLCAAPIAIIANITRVLVIAISSKLISQEVATGIYHNFSGIIVFITAVLSMIATSKLLNINYRETLNKWKPQK